MGICERLLTLREAASLLRLHPKTLQNMAIRCEVPAIKILQGWRFRESDLQGWINSLLRLPQNNSGKSAPGGTHIAKRRTGTPGWLKRMRDGKR